WELNQDLDSVTLSQPKLIKKGIELLGMEDCKPLLTPLAPGIKLLAPTEEEKKEFEKLNINYRSHTGLLNILSCRTRPELAPVVSMLSIFNRVSQLGDYLQPPHLCTSPKVTHFGHQQYKSPIHHTYHIINNTHNMHAGSCSLHWQIFPDWILLVLVFLWLCHHLIQDLHYFSLFSLFDRL
ncbi:hypothetical protein VP01_7908g1, partial [Puccinia sorghi]